MSGLDIPEASRLCGIFAVKRGTYLMNHLRLQDTRKIVIVYRFEAIKRMTPAPFSRQQRVRCTAGAVDKKEERQMTASLQSGLFAGDAALQQAADTDSGHVLPGAIGDHVAKLQTALLFLTTSRITNAEFLEGRYGTTTTEAVLAYKEAREIINFSYQKKADNIVGKMTMTRLDKDLTESQLASLVFDLGERARIEGLLLSLRLGVLRMVTTTLESLTECKEAFELSIIHAGVAASAQQKCSTIDGLNASFRSTAKIRLGSCLVSSRTIKNTGPSSPGSPAISAESTMSTFSSGSGPISSVTTASSWRAASLSRTCQPPSPHRVMARCSSRHAIACSTQPSRFRSEDR